MHLVDGEMEAMDPETGQSAEEAEDECKWNPPNLSALVIQSNND